MFAARAASRVAMTAGIARGAATARAPVAAAARISSPPPAAGAAAARVPNPSLAITKRHMGGGPRVKQEYTGFEKVVRDRLPEDYQVVIAVMSTYVGLYVTYRLYSKLFKKPEPEKETTVTVSVSGEIPDGEEFWKWIESEENLNKYLAKIEE